jgi:hypothetical protein
MPKGRRSNMYADGPGAGGGGGYDPGGSGVEPQAIPTVTPPIVVESFSRTRHQVESLTISFTGVTGGAAGGGGRVTSSGGQQYDTTPDSCTCPDFRFHHHECRHIRALRQAMGLPPLEAGWRPRDNTVAQTVVEPQINQLQHNQDEVVRDRLAQIAEIDQNQTFVSNNEQAWSDLLQRASEPPVYETESVLDGPDSNTFGVEIEFVGGNREALGRALYQAGLTEFQTQQSYHSGARAVSLKWRYEKDASVDGEIISPILRDTPESWQQIQQVCEIAKAHGATVNQRCGAHVHIGKAPLDENRNRKYRLHRLIGGNEDLIYRVAAAGESEGNFRGTHYAQPIGERISDRRPRNDADAERQIGTRGNGYPALAMREQTVEFRYFNGTLTPEQIQANIKLAYQAVATAATTNRRTERGQFIPETFSEVSLLGQHSRINPDDLSSVKRFIDAVFTKTKDRVSFMRSFLNSRWQGAM